MTVSQVLIEYLKHAQRHYRKRGEVTGELYQIKSAMRPLKRLYGSTPAAEFGPKRLKAVRQALMDGEPGTESQPRRGMCRSTINKHVQRIRRVFKWAVGEEIVPPSVYHGLQAVDGLQRGRSGIKESEPVEPVAKAIVDATLPHLQPIVADMVRLQLLAGCRPEEVCMLRPCDVDTSAEVWTYTPESHKTEHHGRQRRIPLGPRAQEILRPYLLRDKASYCFVPVEGECKRNAQRREARVSPMTPSQAKRKRKRSPKRTAGDRYDTASYRRAITRACELAFGMPKEWRRIDDSKLEGEELATVRAKANAWRKEHCWAPNQLRHTAGTEIRQAFGLEAAQTVLGHSKADVTQIYAERDWEKAREVAAKIG